MPSLSLYDLVDPDNQAMINYADIKFIGDDSPTEHGGYRRAPPSVFWLQRAGISNDMVKELRDKIANGVSLRSIVQDTTIPLNILQWIRDGFIEWNKVIKTPVFMINGIDSYNGIITVNKNIPILQEQGFASLIPAEQMYQDISMFITNELTEQMKMPTMTNKEKIASHGFDSKTSFRGK